MNMSVKRKIVKMLVLMVVLLLVFSGCGSKDGGETTTTTKSSQATGSGSSDDYPENLTPPGQLPIVKEQVTLSVLTGSSKSVEDFNENYATKWMQEKTNVKIDWQFVSGSDSADKVNLMLASGTDLPDIMMTVGLTKAQMALYGGEGVFIPLEGLLDKYGYYMKEAVKLRPAIVDQMTAPDGHLYAAAYYAECFHCMYSQKMWINSEWLDILGLPMPTTTDEFYNVLKAFKEGDPNRNNKADEIPLSAAPLWQSDIDGFLMNAFIYSSGSSWGSDTPYMNMVNDTVIPAFTQPEWREGLRYIAMLYNEGLLDKECFVQKNEQLQAQIMGDVTLVGAFPQGAVNFVTDPTSRQCQIYEAVPPLKGPNGNNTCGYYIPSALDYESIVITSACEYPEVAFRWTDFQYEKTAHMVTMYGEENVDWRWAKEGEIGMNGKPAIFAELNVLQGNPNQNKAWLHRAPMLITADEFGGRVDDPTVFNVEKKLSVETETKYVGHEPEQIVPPLFFAKEDAARFSELKTNITEYVRESISMFVTGALNIETDWDKYLREFDALGLDEYTKIIQDTYNRQYLKK